MLEQKSILMENMLLDVKSVVLMGHGEKLWKWLSRNGTGGNRMDEIDKAIDKLRRACQCLYLEGEPIIYAADVKARAEAVIDQFNECRGEVRLYEERFKRAVRGDYCPECELCHEEIERRTKNDIWVACQQYWDSVMYKGETTAMITKNNLCKAIDGAKGE